MATPLRRLIVHCVRVLAALALVDAAPASADEPTAPAPSQAAPAPAAPSAAPPAIDSRVPYLGEQGQRKYQHYLTLPLPRAFAISESGAFGIASGPARGFGRRPDDPKLRALEFCREMPEAVGHECVLYSVDNEVVFGKTAAPAAFRPPGASPPTAGTTPPAVAPESQAPAGPVRTPAPYAATARARARVRFVGDLVLEHQFNAIATVTYSDGSKASLGDALVGLNAGAAFPLTADGRFEIQGLAGVLVSRLNASNGDATFWDFPVEITAQANVGSFRLGVGPALHIAPMVRGSGFASSADLDFSTTVGAVARVEYRFTEKFGLGAHFSWLRLSANGGSIDASRIGMAFSLYL